MTEAQGPVPTLPIQIRDDLIVRIAPVPFDLTELEAQKICRVVMALAVASQETGNE